jgi:hypothetical protein
MSTGSHAERLKMVPGESAEAEPAEAARLDYLASLTYCLPEKGNK